MTNANDTVQASYVPLRGPVDPPSFGEAVYESTQADALSTAPSPRDTISGSTPHPDTVLIELDRQHAAITSALAQVAVSVEGLADIGLPAPPEALLLRTSDHDLGLASYAVERADGRLWFCVDQPPGSDLCKPRMRWTSRALGPDDGPCNPGDTLEYLVPWPEAQARADEIAAAYRAWLDATERAQAASGYIAAVERERAFVTQAHALEDEIEAFRPRTLNGLALKARHFMRGIERANVAGGLEAILIGDILALSEAAV